jgi:3'(2'), 5'-bisphosphate nucleotidase
MAVTEFSPDTCARLLCPLTELIAAAAVAVLRVPRNSLAARLKSDYSPVTAADEAAEAVVLGGLKDLLPGVPVVSEESAAPTSLGRTFILVDPLDGTREFLAGRDEYTINIGLVQDGRPIAGLIAAPAQGLIWRGVVGQGAERLPIATDESKPNTGPIAIRTRAMPERPVAVVSRSHLDPASEGFLSRWQNVTRTSCGSALKFCRLGEGTADVYPRLAPTSEWDIAAGHAIVVAAGGVLTRPDGMPITYGDAGFRIPAFVAWGDPAAAFFLK